MARVRDLSTNGGRFGVGQPDPPMNSRLSRPGYDIIDITLSDSADQLPGSFYQGFMVTVAGNVAIIDPDGVTTIIPGCQAGVQYAQLVRRFLSTGTTATGIKGIL